MIALITAPIAMGWPTLTLDEGEARWLGDLVQHPLHGLDDAPAEAGLWAAKASIQAGLGVGEMATCGIGAGSGRCRGLTWRRLRSMAR